QTLRTVSVGGSGKVNFTPTEGTGVKRQIVAQVNQDGNPRANITVASFTASNPSVGSPKNVRVKRKGTKAIVTWNAAKLGKAYEVIASYGVGRRLLITPKNGVLKATVPNLTKGEGLTVQVVAISPA